MTNYIEFAAKIKEKYPQYKDVDDLTLAKKVVEKYPQYKEKVEFEEVKTKPEQPKKKNIDVTPSGIAKGAASNISALLRMPIYGEDFQTAKSNAEQNIRQAEQKHPVALGGLEFANDLAAYSKIPVLRGQGIKNFLANAALQGGTVGAAEGLKRGGDVGSAVGGGAMGTGIAAALQGISPAVAKGAMAVGRGISDIAPRVASKISQTELSTILQAMKPESKALDLNKEQAQNLLMNTTERIRGAYKDLLNKKGDTVGNLLKELPDDKAVKAKNILDNYDAIYNSYSLSGNKDLNPAINATKREYETIKDLLLGDGKQRTEEFRQALTDLEFPKSYLETVKNRHRNQFHTTVLDTLGNDIIKNERAFNENILKRIKDNPEILKNPEEFAKLENEVEKYAHYDDSELNDRFWSKFYEAVGKADEILGEGQNYIKPKELYDINKNINNMIDWDKPSAALKNDVLEQMYLSNAKRISDISPQLKAANKAYADLMDFQKNEGIRRILNNQNNIDTASSALRNYNSTVTKGNTNRNIQDLERILVQNNEKPFLNDIDDVNAAMDLLKKEGTGMGGIAGLVKDVTVIPALKGIKKFKQSEIPEKLITIKDELKKLGRFMPSLGTKAGANMLYGGVEYNDYQN